MNRTHGPWRERWRQRWRQRWRKLRALPPEQRALILRAVPRLCLVVAGLRLLGFRRSKWMIERFSLPRRGRNFPAASRTQERAALIVRSAQSVERNLPVESNCLERSLALWWMLRLEGFPAELRIGARNGPQGFEAHAWVEWDGQVLNDSADVHQHYARFDAPHAAARADSP